MSQKFRKIQNSNDESTAYGKWFATAVYDQHFIETEQLAEFIQTQATVKKSDIWPSLFRPRPPSRNPTSRPSSMNSVQP